MGSLFEYRHLLRRHLPCNRADLFGNCCGCRFYTEASGGCKQQERLSREHVESDPSGEERDELAAAYHDNFDVDHHDNSYDYHGTNDKHDLHQHVNDDNNDCDNHNDADHVLKRDWTLVWLDQRLEHTNPGHAGTQC
jgi:hypothetical protein